MFRLLDIFLFTLERLWRHRVLVVWVLVGLSAATTLALSLLLYVDAVNTNLLSSYLTDPPYAFRFRYLGSWQGNITQADVTSATAATEGTFVGTMGLPTTRQVRYISGGAWTVRFADGTPLGAFTVGTLEGAESQIQIVSGEWPVESPAEGEPLPVLVSEKMLYQMGIQQGDILSVTRPGAAALEFRVAALWTPANSADTTWIFPPKFFDQVILIPQDALWQITEGIERPVEEADWFLIFNGSSVKTSDVDGLLTRIVDGQRLVTTALPGIRMDLTPTDGLQAFNITVSQLTQQLVIVILPVSGLVLYFVVMVAGLLVSRQQNEDVTLRSRGMSRRGLMTIHALMWLTLAGIALGIGLTLAPGVVRLVGQTTSFLRFDGRDLLTAPFTPEVILAGLFTGLLAASSGLVLAWRTMRQTITSFRQQQARVSRAWWQRVYLDFAVLLPALYVFYTLWRQGGLVTDAKDPFSDPLVFIAPTLFSLGVTLLFLRVWPFLLRVLGGIIAYGNDLVLLMALRELTRSIGRYRGTLLMMCFTLSLTGFTASMASTLDRSLKDSIDYSIGADAMLVVVASAETESSTDSSGQTTQTVTGYTNLPVEDLLSVKGVAEVSPSGRYPARLVLASQRVDGTVLGIDRATIAGVVRSRADYASESFADLFNRLAGNRTGIIINQQTADAYHLVIGQEVTMQVSALNSWHETKVPIVGIVNYFPTLDPKSGFFAITNLQPIFETVGTELPYDIWMRLNSGADVAAVQQQVYDLGYPVLRWLDPEDALRTAQSAPSRRGVLGFLSVGFVASIMLTLIGAAIQSAASFRAQATQLGSLRAMGLSGSAVGMYLMFLQGIAASSGILSGTTIGVVTTLLFLPLLDFSGGLPPYLIRVAWGDIILVYVAFAAVLLIVTLFTTIFLGRERLSTIIKLGEV
ncbi:MAG: ABC transporter permease [Anaerolineae bacterium]|nr:ABC transporter permease [Anaerolineae bacterium]